LVQAKPTAAAKSLMKFMCRGCYQKRAYSLSEVLLAIWLFTFIGGALMAGFAYLAKTGAVSSDQASAELLADEICETARYVGPPTWGHETLSGTRIFSLESGAESRFDWVFEPSLIESSGMGKYYQLKVVVNWEQHKDGVEQGRRELTRVRYLYLDDL
jgi:hypothetical protein